MKKYLSVLTLALLVTPFAGSAQATIQCTITNPQRDFVVMERILQSGSKKDTIQLDSRNSFKFVTAELDEIQPYRISYGERASKSDPVESGNQMRLITYDKVDKIDVLLDNGYNLVVTVDANNRDNSLTINGKGKELSEYYAKKQQKINAFSSSYGSMMRVPKDSFLSYLNNHYTWLAEHEKTLSKIPYVPKSYVQGIQEDMKFSKARSMCYYATQNIIRFKNDSILNFFDDQYFSFLKNIPFDNPANRNDNAYTMFIRNYTNYQIARRTKGVRLSEEQDFTEKYEIYKTMFKSDELRDFQMFDMLYQKNSKAREPWYEACVKDYNQRATNDSLKYEINNILVIRQKMGKGMPAYNFTVYDNEGNKHSLSDFKGQYVLIDVWATWCKPCVLEIPYLQKMEEEWKGKPVVFMSISIDKDTTRWKNFLVKRELHGNQFWNGFDKSEGFNKEFLIQGIPRFILIDPNGNFVDPNAPRPSMPDLGTLLRSQEGLKSKGTAPAAGAASGGGN